MDPRLRSQRLWQLLDQFPHKLLYRIGRAARLSVSHGTHKHDLIEALCALPEPALERAFVGGLPRQDLQALCKRIGYASSGSQVDLAARLLAAVDDPAVHAPRWRPFAEARSFAHRLEFTSQKEWFAFVRGEQPAKGTLPSDIPRYPNEAYEKAGWTTWGDFLGTGFVATTKRTHRPFHQARAYARSLELASQAEWYAFVQGRLHGKGSLPSDIPKLPSQAYANAGWTTWGDFLGTGNVAHRQRTYRPFQQARAYARSLGLANRAEWQALSRGRTGNRRTLPLDIPTVPERVYAGLGWAGYGDWLGTGRVRSSNYQYRSYAEACVFVRALGIRTYEEWWVYCRGELSEHGPRPLDIPSAPDRVYRGQGWLSWGDFLGTNVVASFKRRSRSFAAARAYVRKQGLRSSTEWRAWCAAGNRPADIPSTPHVVYRDRGWVSWGDFLGTGNVHHSRIRRGSFAAMRTFVRRLSLRTGVEFVRAKRDGRIPKHIPTRIDQHPDWKGWADFLGPSYTGRWGPASRRARTRSRRS